MEKLTAISMIALMTLSTFALFAPQVKAQGVWISKASMPTARYSMAAVSYGERIYVIGGADDSGGSPVMLSTLEVYDPATDTWSSKTPMPTPRNNVGAAVIGGKIYVVGYDNITYCYDPATDSWSEKAKIPLPLHPSTWRQGVGVGVINGKMYVSPGEPWMYCYDPSTDTWTEKACVPSTGGRPHDIQGFAVLDDKLYAFGDTYTTRVDVYDPVTDTWTAGAIPDIPSVRTSLGPTIPVLNGKIYVIGGWNGGSAQSTVLVYDSIASSWSTETSMPTARWGPAYAIANGKIYVIGGNWGGAGGHPQSVNEEFTPPTPPPSKKLSVDAEGAHDYLPWENVKVKIWALVADVNTMEPVSDADVTITIYDPEDNLWINDTMTEKLNHGIYLWESTETVREIFRHHEKGVYVVHVEASYGDGPTASDILTFHIDPPPEENYQLPIIIGSTLTSIAILAIALLYIIKKQSP